MLPDLTPAVARAFDAAQHQAVRLGAAEVQPEHLLHGLLAEEEGRAAVVLASAGLDVAAARQRLAGNAAATAHPPETPLPLSPRIHVVLRHAGQLAGAVSADRSLASDQVVVALLCEDEALRQQLDALGLSFDWLQNAARPALAAPLPMDEPLHLAEHTEQVDTARILDAEANRAREALRVVEDYCRFVLDDSLLTGEAKKLRHDLSEALAAVAPGVLLEARETLRDVGTVLSTPREQQRYGLLAVVQANLKRLQEALRSLEEFGKLRGPDLGRAIEQLRYRSYTLERALVLGSTARQRLAGVRLYVLATGSACAASIEWTIQEAAAGGAGMIQLREKTLPDRTLLERARQVRRYTQKAGVLFILNDRPDIARLAEADGVHVGQEELPVKEVRRIMGPGALVGVSTHDIDQVRRAVLDGASYIGVGPTFPSATKDFGTLAGPAFVRQVAAETSLPAFVIGGVNRATIAQAVAAGGRRVAVAQAVCQADDPRQVAAELIRSLPTLPTGHPNT
jgi:thiamine-phosphate pyrophosphorylase